MSDSASFFLSPDRYSGKKMGKYEVLCRLSTGGMSEIFLAFQRGMAGFQKLVVLKKILPDIRGEEEIVRMFLNEAKITAAFSHPNIAHIYDLDVAEDDLFLAMEFIPGSTLIDVARACRQANEAIPLGLTLATMRDTALALHYAHTFTDPAGRSRQVIHRDVAEKNIMVTYEGVTKLLDFGIAKAMGRSSRTAAGKVKGTSGYMSPEQIRGEELDPRSDVFGLGVVMHECLTGMRLFYAKSPEEGMRIALEMQPPPPSHQNSAVPPELDAIVLKALEREREDRFSTALELARAIDRVGGREIWRPEQCGDFIRRHFSDRREQTRQLLEGAMPDERTGEIRLPKHLLSSQRGGASYSRGAGHESPRPVRVEPLSSPPVPKKAGAVLTMTPGVLPPPPSALRNQTGSQTDLKPPSFHEEQTIIKSPPKKRAGKATVSFEPPEDPVDEESPEVVTDPLLSASAKKKDGAADEKRGDPHRARSPAPAKPRSGKRRVLVLAGAMLGGIVLLTAFGLLLRSIF